MCNNSFPFNSMDDEDESIFITTLSPEAAASIDDKVLFSRSMSFSYAGGEVSCAGDDGGSINKTANTSNGFQITIDVLDRHIRQTRLSPRSASPQIEPTGLDLQLAAIARLKALADDSCKLAKFLINFIIATETDCERRKLNVEKLNANLQADGISDQLYHIAKEKHGNLFLRVVKSPVPCQGLLSFRFIFLMESRKKICSCVGTIFEFHHSCSRSENL